ncbi:MAG: hypothetical protein ACON46_09060 [Coraliomargaritaceae bacterium]
MKNQADILTGENTSQLNDPGINTTLSGNPRKPQRTRKAGLAQKIFLIIAVIATFGWMLSSSLLWTEFDVADRNAFEQMDYWYEAMTLEHLLNRELLPSLSYFAEQATPLPTASVHRSINLILHLTAAFLLLHLLQRFNLSGAFAATLVFALHPAVVQTLFWPGYRVELIGLISILLAVIVTLQQNKNYYLLSLLFCTLAIFLHPAAVFLPVILALCIYFKEKEFALENFNPVLPLSCATLLINAWMQSKVITATESSPTLQVWLYYAGQNIYFFLRQALYPGNPSLFYPYDTESLEQATIDLNLLPFCLFLPFYIIAFIKLRQPWGRALLLGLTSFILLLLPGIQSPGANLAGNPAHEDYNLYIALPPLIALIVCGTKTIVNRVARTGKGLWYIALSLFLVFEVIKSANFSYLLRSSENMWRVQSKQWPDQWIPSAALARELQNQESTSVKQRELKRLLESLLDTHPDRLPERMLLLQAYLDTEEKNNALNQYRYILRETEPPLPFMQEAAAFFDSMNLTREAERTRARLQQRLDPPPKTEIQKPTAASILQNLAGEVSSPEPLQEQPSLKD